MSLPGWFHGFLKPDADRCSVLETALGGSGIGFTVLRTQAGSFVVARPRKVEHDGRWRSKVVTAHYDRVPGTQGALDNSAACLQLWSWLVAERPSLNLSVVFTDHEELSGRPATEQGAYALGQAFGSLGIHRPLVFTLDVTGRGDTLVSSSSAAALRQEGGSMAALAAEVEGMSAALARALGRRVFRARVPFGEDLGFLRAGVPALQLTVLPADEAAELSGKDGLPPWASLEWPPESMPYTWRLLHSRDDVPALYTDDAFGLIDRVMDALAGLAVPAGSA